MAVALALAGCGGIPRDPEGTLERIRGGTMPVPDLDVDSELKGPED